jgi:hypothetical protein
MREFLMDASLFQSGFFGNPLSTMLPATTLCEPAGL